MNTGLADQWSAAPPVARASSRGKYDRDASPSQRVQRQRSQLLSTVRRLASSGTVPTVTQVVNAAGIGRNTFYQHFRGAEDALACAAEAERARLGACLEQVSQGEMSVTPSQHSEGLAEAWVRFCEQQSEALALLEAHVPAELESLLEQAIRRTHHLFAHAGYAPAEIADAFVVAVGGSLRAIGSAIGSKAASQSAAGGLEPAEAVAVVQLVLLRMLR